MNVFWIVDEESWKKGGELVEKKPNLKTEREIGWIEEVTGDNFMLFCELLKGNAIPTEILNLNGDEKQKRLWNKDNDKNEINREEYWWFRGKDDSWSIEKQQNIEHIISELWWKRRKEMRVNDNENDMTYEINRE